MLAQLAGTGECLETLLADVGGRTAVTATWLQKRYRCQGAIVFFVVLVVFVAGKLWRRVQFTYAEVILVKIITGAVQNCQTLKINDKLKRNVSYGTGKQKNGIPFYIY